MTSFVLELNLMEANNNNNKPEDILQQLSEQDVNKLELQYIEGAEKTEVKNLSDAEAQQHAQKAYDNTLGAKSRIMLCGKSGVGKSSLVNFTFKKDKAKVHFVSFYCCRD
jgi:putative ribosome biogenesis GTPase RsgA